MKTFDEMVQERSRDYRIVHNGMVYRVEKQVEERRIFRRRKVWKPLGRTVWGIHSNGFIPEHFEDFPSALIYKERAIKKDAAKSFGWHPVEE